MTNIQRQLPVSQRLAYLGFSQGAAMAYRAAAGSGHPCQGVVVLGGDVPPELEGRDLASFPPVLLGRGKRFFPDSVDPRGLAFVSTQATPRGVLLNAYCYVVPLGGQPQPA